MYYNHEYIGPGTPRTITINQSLSLFRFGIFRGCVRLLIRPSVRSSFRPSVRPSVGGRPSSIVGLDFKMQVIFFLFLAAMSSSRSDGITHFVRSSVRPSVRPSVFLSLSPSSFHISRSMLHLFVRPSVHPFVHLSVCPSSLHVF